MNMADNYGAKRNEGKVLEKCDCGAAKCISGIVRSGGASSSSLESNFIWWP